MFVETLATLAHQSDERRTWVKEVIEISEVGARFRYRIAAHIEVGPVVAIEIARQAVHCFAHLQLEVPVGGRSLLTRAAFAAVDGAQFGRSGELTLLCRAHRSGAGKKVSVATSIEFRTDCVHTARSEIDGTYLAADLYERIERMSRSATTNIRPSIAERARALLRLNPRKPRIESRHAHVTGMQIVSRTLDATRQHRAVQTVERLEATFTRVGDARAPIEIDRRERAHATIAQVRQQGAEIAQVQVRFAAPDRHLAHD